MAKSATTKAKNSEVDEAVEKNDEEWQKRMLLLVMIMLIAVLGLN